MQVAYLRVPPIEAQFRTARMVAASVARQADFPAEQVEDVKLAVNEACALHRGAVAPLELVFDLEGARLRDCFALRAVLGGSRMAGADLTGSDFTGAEAEDVDFSGATLRGTRLAGASLAGAVFREAELERADFTHADVARSDFSRARNLPAQVTELFIAPQMGMAK